MKVVQKKLIWETIQDKVVPNYTQRAPRQTPHWDVEWLTISAKVTFDLQLESFQHDRDHAAPRESFIWTIS